MNIIDNKFNELYDFLSNLSEEELFNHILKQYKYLPTKMQMIHKNYFDRFQFWGRIDLDNQNYEYFELKAKDISNNLDSILWLYNRLNDYSSKRLLLAILDNWVNYNVDLLSSTIDKQNKHYFDLDLIPNCQNEVIVDLGAYVGDTVLDYISTYGVDSYKKIYCYEITSNIYQKLIANTIPFKNIDCRLKAVKDKECCISVNTNTSDLSSNRTTSGSDIKCVTLDKDIVEPITMIKMDIEGDEPYAIMGASNHIKNDSPKLMISLYHNNRHLWELPKMVDELNPSYNFYMRNYCGSLYPTEIVLIAVPK